MDTEALWSGIAGGLRGGVTGYQWQKERQDRQRERQDVLDAREEDRRVRQDAEARHERDSATATQRAEEAAQDHIIDSLSDSELKRGLQADRARRRGLKVDAKDFEKPTPRVPIPGRTLPSLGIGYDETFGDRPSASVAPKYSIDPAVQATQAKTAAAEAATTAKRTAAIEDYEKRKKIDRQYEKPAKGSLPVTAKDDPSLPHGVKQYLGTLRQKYGTLDGSVSEFNDAIDDLYAEHPNLDAAKARRFIDTLYKPTTPVGRPKSEVEQMIEDAQRKAQQPSTPPAPSKFSAIVAGARSLIGGQQAQPPPPGDPAAAVRGGGFQRDVTLPVENVSDADIDTLAKSILTTQGVPATPENLKTFTSKKRNRDRLIEQIKRVRAGGAR